MPHLEPIDEPYAESAIYYFLMTLKSLLLSPLFFLAISLHVAGDPTLWQHMEQAREEILAGHVIFKLTGEAVDLSGEARGIPAELHTVLDSRDVRHLSRVFPHHRSPEEKTHARGLPLVDLSRIYELVVDEPEQMVPLIRDLLLSGLVEYAQPRYVPRSLEMPWEVASPAEVPVHRDQRDPEAYFPNDSLLYEQYYLWNISAFQAWALWQGDTSSVVAIVDTGVDLQHPDLVDAIFYNWDDPINGEDSDGDGFVDNFYGWDLGEGNNDPSFNNSAHGIHVSGIAAATPDNGEGIAGVGFHTRFLPVKIDDAFGRLVKAYEGIVYAADQGVDVINCSWGSHFNPGPFGQDIVDYAVLNKDVLVVAAAGNANNDLPFFPASLKRVVSVAATDSLDHKAGFSTFNPFVDVSAPGSGIMSTWVYDGYMLGNGTSMASPVVAGAAGLLRSYRPQLDALQAGAQLRITADPIDSLEANEAYAGKLGSGRLNMVRALTEDHWPYIWVPQHMSSAEELAFVRPGDSFGLEMEFQNLLAPANGVYALLQSNSPYLEVLNDSIWLGEMDSGYSTDNLEQPFLLQAAPGMPRNHEVIFSLSFFDGEEGVGRKSFRRWINLDYLTVEAGDIRTTLSSRAAIGFNYPNYSQGAGLSFRRGYTVLKSGGIILANDPFQVVDNVYGESEGSFSESLIPLILPESSADHPLASLHVRGQVEACPTTAGSIPGIVVDYDVFFWDGQEAEDFFILRYLVRNTSSTDFPSFSAGFFADWVLRNAKQHRAAIDVSERLAYAYSDEGGHYTGIQMLSTGPMRHYAFDNQGAQGSMRIDNGFSGYKKHRALTSNRMEAGFYHPANDISSLLSLAPASLAAGDSLELAVAIHLADELDDMLAGTETARHYYRLLSDMSTEVTESPGMDCPHAMTVFPNPASGILQISFCEQLQGSHQLALYNMQAKRLWSERVDLSSDSFIRLNVQSMGLPKGIYLLRLTDGLLIESQRILIL